KGASRHRLAAAGFTHDAHRFTAIDPQVNGAHDALLLPAHSRRHGQPIHAEQGAVELAARRSHLLQQCPAHLTLPRSYTCSLTQSRMMFMEAAVMTIIAPGASADAAFVYRSVSLSANIRPQSGAPGGTPNPRKDRPDNATMA